MELRINRINPDNLSSLHINDMLVTHTENEFFISFFQIEPPGITDVSEVKGLKNID